MIVFINVRNDNGTPVVSRCHATAEEAFESAKHKITWAHGAYWPDYFDVAVPVNFDKTKTFNIHTREYETRGED